MCTPSGVHRTAHHCFVMFIHILMVVFWCAVHTLHAWNSWLTLAAFCLLYSVFCLSSCLSCYPVYKQAHKRRASIFGATCMNWTKFYIFVGRILAASPYAAMNRKNFTPLHFSIEAPALLNENQPQRAQRTQRKDRWMSFMREIVAGRVRCIAPIRI